MRRTDGIELIIAHSTGALELIIPAAPETLVSNALNDAVMIINANKEYSVA